MKKHFLAYVTVAALLAMALAPAAMAVGPIESIVSSPAKKQTFSAVVTGLTAAASATDFFTITGSATTTIKVRSIGCTGTSTAAGSLVVTATRRSTANTAGTSTTATAVPLDSTDAAATATVRSYTANPTLGTTVGAINSGLLSTVVAASAGVNGLRFDYGPDDVRQAPTLRGVTQVLALNAGGASLTAGASLTCEVKWTEE